LTEILKALCLTLLFLILSYFTSNTPPLCKIERGVLGSSLLCFLCLFVIWRQLEGTRDLFDEAGKFSWGLRCDSFDISLEDEEVLCFDKDIMGDESGIVGSIRDNPNVQTILGCTSGRNAIGG
jgi:hypothetical protein